MGQQEIHEHEALGGGSVRRLYCWLTSFSRSLQTILRINLDGTKDFRESGDIPVRGSGNYASDEQKEIARLRRELRDAQDALDVLKKQSTFWENDGRHLP